MNPRRVHELMRQHFPSVDAASREWIHIIAPDGLREPELLHLLERFIPADFVLIEVHRKLGGYIARDEAIKFTAAHWGEGEIHIADRDFRGFVVIGHNGVATGWSDKK
ncbi:hypothetical protein [Cupriavidus basilensis]|uniref:hypothetical protein n=1 Tax=Cupriavidus basilensis TaxID=68895 RepID=UPI0009E47FF0|nr:hypothetical protein [Cupriavidus basilensis]